MEAKEVVNKILSEAKAQADDIIGKAKKEAAEYNKQTDEQIADFNEKTEQLAKAAAEDKTQRVLASARMKSRKDILAAKQQLLGEVFEKASKKLADMNKDEYRSLYKKLISASMESGDEVIVIGRKEDAIDKSLVEELNKELKDGGSLSLADEKGDFNRGVVLVRGDVRINISVQVLMQMARENLETKIADEIFSK